MQSKEIAERRKGRKEKKRRTRKGEWDGMRNQVLRGIHEVTEQTDPTPSLHLPEYRLTNDHPRSQEIRSSDRKKRQVMLVQRPCVSLLMFGRDGDDDRAANVGKSLSFHVCVCADTSHV